MESNEQSGRKRRGAAGAQRACFVVSIALSLALCIWLTSRDAQLYGALAGGLGALLLVGWLLPARAGGWLLALGVLNGLTLLPELALRAGDFQFVSGVQFGYPTPEEFWELVPDEELLGKLPPGDNPPVNSLGFLGPEPGPGSPERLRLVVLGDSCSQQGWPLGWPEHLAARLSAEGWPCDLVNLSMSGYSTHQGRALAEGVLAELEPDVVLAYYGWNDHWAAYGATDAEKRASVRRERLYRASRLLQWLRKLRSAGSGPPEPLGVTRVPEDDFRANLTAMTAAVEGMGAELVLITAPSAHGLTGVPDYLVEERFVPSAQAALDLHARYLELTREVAAAGDAALLDLAKEFERGVDPDIAFLEDGIHLSPSGRKQAAAFVARYLKARGLVVP